MLASSVQVAYFEPRHPRTLDSQIIAATTLDDLLEDYLGTAWFDLIVGGGGSGAPAAHAALAGLGSLAVLVDPPVVGLRTKSPTIERYLDSVPLDAFMDRMAEAAEPHAEDLAKGRVGTTLDATLGPYVTDERGQHFLELGKRVMEQRLPFDETLSDRLTEEDRRAADWLSPWTDNPARVRLLLSRPAPLVLEGLKELAPQGEVQVVDWPQQAWIQAPEVVAEALLLLVNSGA